MKRYAHNNCRDYVLEKRKNFLEHRITEFPLLENPRNNNFHSTIKGKKIGSLQRRATE